MSNKSGHAELRFANAGIAGVVTTVGDTVIKFIDEASSLGLSDAEVTRLQRVLGLEQRHVVSGDITTADLCEHSARKLFVGCDVDPLDIQALIFVTQTPDYGSPATAISMQHRLGLPITSMAFDVRLGCSGFVYGLTIAYSLVEAGFQRVLLCVGDVASRMIDPTDHAIAPIMGDAGSAILIERKPTKSYFQLYSDGSGARALMIPHSGIRKSSDDDGLPTTMQMDGAAVFNFTLQRVPGMISDILDFAKITADDVDYFVLHQPNKYILRNLQKRIKASDEKMPIATQSVYGNQNSASIPGTISGFLADKFSSSKVCSIFAGFGIGLSWGACMLETDSIYAPPVFVGLES